MHETTVDSLLKEIDDEMEQTKCNAMQKTVEGASRDWKLPLQDIGDDTMEMLVKHNTRSNSHAADNASRKGQSSSRRSIISNESFGLELLRVNSEPGEPSDTVFQKSPKSFAVNGSPCPKNSPKVLNNLKNMAHDIDDLTREDERPARLDSSPLKFTLKSTQPLLSYPESPTHRSSIEIETNYDDEEEEEDADAYLAQSPQILHSPSRIPITNAVSINKFNLDLPMNVNGFNKRLASGDSVDSTEHELDTKTIPKLPYCMPSTPEMTAVEDKCPQLPYIVKKSLPGSRSPTASVEDLNITTSVLEASDRANAEITSSTDVIIKNDSVEDLQHNTNHVHDAFSEEKLPAESYEKKPIPSSDNNVTTPNQGLSNKPGINAERNFSATIQDLSEETSLVHTESKFGDIGAQLNDMPTEDELDNTEADISTSTKPEESPVTENEATEQEYQDIENPPLMNKHTDEHPTALKDDVAEKDSINSNDENESFENFEDATNHEIVHLEGQQLIRNIQHSGGSKTHDSQINLDQGETVTVNGPPTEGKDGENESSISSEHLVATQDNYGEDRDDEKEVAPEHKQEEKEQEQIPILPPLPKWEAIQFSEPFADENDTSNDSIDLTRSMKPSDYISIWHIQEEEIKSTSPESIANSQFSHQSSITTASTIDFKKENASTSFKFKPRIVSRSKIYNPKNRVSSLNYYDSEDYILNSSEWNALDPMRRNTLISKKIQDNIRTQKGLTPFLSPSAMKPQDKNFNFQNHIVEEEQEKAEEEEEEEQEEEEQEEEEQEEEDILSNIQPSEEGITTNINSLGQDFSINTQEEPETSVREIKNVGDITFNKSDLLSLSVDEELGQDFANFLDALDHDSTSFNYALDEAAGFNRDDSKKSFSSLWEKNYELKPPPSIRNQSIAPDVLQKLLESDAKSVTELKSDNEEEINVAHMGLGIGTLKTPVKDVSVALAASIRGYEASFSDSDSHLGEMINSDVMTLNMFDDFEEDEMTPCTPTGGISPVKRHISSPFKVIKAGNIPKCDEINVKTEEEPEIAKLEHTGSLESDTPPPVMETKEEMETQLEEPGETEEEFPDLGTLYLTVKGISTLALYGTKSHRATYSIVFDNGKNVIQTSWEALPYDGNIRINKEFELPIDFMKNKESSSLSSRESNYRKCTITLKCRYERAKHELVEVVDRVPVGKSFFGKTKYKLEKRYVQKTAKQDEWDYLFAQDGSFARCEFEIDEDFLNNAAFSTSHMRYDMINKWSRIADRISNSTRFHELPRKPPHKVASLDVEACFLQRTSAFEQFPKTLSIVNKIISKYESQKNIHKEGYLLQDGGDLNGKIESRFFKLHGSQLSGYHEISKKAKIDINLLKVTEVLCNEDIQTKDGERRNFTEWVLFNECFQLVFDDGERITFNAECSSEEKNDWYNKLKEVVELNAFHQPWVKNFGEKLAI